MPQHRVLTSVRAAVVLLGALAAGIGAARLAVPFVRSAAAPLLASGPGGLDVLAFDDALLGLCAVVLLGCVLWLSLATSLTAAAYVAAGLSPRSPAVVMFRSAVGRLCPAAVERLVAGAVGVGAVGVVVSAGLAGPAVGDALPVDPVLHSHSHSQSLSDSHSHSGSHQGSGTGAGRLVGLPLPDRVTGSTGTVRAESTGRSRLATRSADGSEGGSDGRSDGRAAVVAVRPGQSLWTIAADLLPARATDAEITRAWHHLHHANASEIGTDPDLVQPGTRLVVPDLSAPPFGEEAP